MPKKFLILSAVLLLLFFFSRLYNLTLLPIFTDEAIYLRWGQIALGDPVWRFISLTDGKQPLFIWLMLPLMKAISDPLLAGRLVSVAAGWLSLVGMGLLGWEISKNRWVALLASFLYLVCPFFLWYDRLALMDSLLTAFGIWSLWLSLVLVRTLRLDVALLLGMTIGGGLLTKSSASFFLYFLPATLLLLDWRSKKRLAHLEVWIALVLVTLLVSQLIYAVLRLSPLYYMIGQKNLTFVFSFQEFFQEPFHFFLGNLRGLSGWLIDYLTIPMVLVTLAAILWGCKKNFWQTLVLSFWFFFPFFSLAAFGRIIFPRFILFMVPPLLLLLAQFLVDLGQKIKNPLFVSVCYSLLFLYPLYFAGQIIFNPINAPLPPADREQYLDGWPAGYGIKEVVNFLQGEGQKGKIFVGTEGTFGLFPASLELYLFRNKNIEIKGYWPTNTAFGELNQKAAFEPTYFISKETENFTNPNLKLISKFRRGKGKTFLQLFSVLPEKK